MKNEVLVIDQEQDATVEETLLDVLPKTIAEKIRFLQEPYFEMSDEKLAREAFGADQRGNARIDMTAGRLKASFWLEHDEATKKRRQMQINKIINGVCTKAQFRKFIDDKLKLAWLIRMPGNYKVILTDIQAMSLENMREIVQMDPWTPDGPDTRLLSLKFQIAEYVDKRLNGAIVQRIDQRNINMNLNADATQEPEKIALSMDEIERRLLELRRKSLSLQAPGNVQVDLLASVTRDPDTMEVDAKPTKPRDRRVS